MNLINEIFKDLKKFDTFLAFTVSYCLFYYYSKNSIKSIEFSIKFVLIFLLFLNILNKN